MNKAEMIVSFHKDNTNAMMNEADDIAIDIDQDVENESTKWTFADDSILVISGCEINTYAYAD